VQKKPAGQSVHVVAPAEEVVPAEHTIGLAVPSGQYDPAVQVVQADCPVVAAYVPARHCALTPPLQKFPAVHGVQDAALPSE
jgi:hypothetical protein